MRSATDGLSLAEFRGADRVIPVFSAPRYDQCQSTNVPFSGEGKPTPGSMTTFQAAPWSVKLSKNIERLRRLGPGWDGPRSVPISSSLINLVNVLIRESLAPLGSDARAPFVVPLPSGGVQVEWHTTLGELEFELEYDGAAAFWVRDHSTGHEFETEGAKAFNQFLFWAPRLAQDQRDVANASLPSRPSIFAVAA